MATIPVIPVVSAGQVVTAAELNALCSTCTFLLSQRPLTRVHDATGGQSLGTSAVSVNFDTVDFDYDGMYSSSSKSLLTVVTPGWWKVRYGIQIAGSTSNTYNVWAQVTTGPNNPQGSGIALTPCAGSAVVTYTSSSPPSYAGAAALIPYYLYAGDYVQIQLQGNATGDSTAATSGWPLSFFCMEMVSALWLRCPLFPARSLTGRLLPSPSLTSYPGPCSSSLT